MGVKRVSVQRVTEGHGGIHLQIIIHLSIPVEAASSEPIVIIIEEDPISATKYAPYQTRMEITMGVMDRISSGILMTTIATINSLK